MENGIEVDLARVCVSVEDRKAAGLVGDQILVCWWREQQLGCGLPVRTSEQGRAEWKWEGGGVPQRCSGGFGWEKSGCLSQCRDP